MTSPVDVHVLKRNQTLNSIVVHQRLACSYQTSFAQDIMKVLACHSDKDGKAVFTPETVVSSAIEITELAFAAFAERGWTTEIPALPTLFNDESTIGFTKEQAA